jgi:hypothetical protein
MAEVEKRNHTQRNIVIILAAVLVIAAIVVCVAPIMSASYTEPYQVQVEKPVSYRVTESHGSEGWNIDLGAYAEAFVSIENTDTVPGTFVVDFAFTTLYRTYSDSDRVYVLPGEVKTLEGLADISWGEDWEWSKTITPGTKTVTETQYQIRYKKVTVLDYLLNY